MSEDTEDNIENRMFVTLSWLRPIHPEDQPTAECQSGDAHTADTHSVYWLVMTYPLSSDENIDKIFIMGWLICVHGQN